MNYYILTAVIGFIAGALVMLKLMVSLELSTIVEKSQKSIPFEINGVNYFFMTQDQIQKAAQAIYKLETEYHKLESEMEVN